MTPGLQEYPMFRRMNVALVLACSVVLAVGCRSGTGTTGRAAAATGAEVTLHVPDMTERLKLT